jgi:hypothetical protein
MMETCESVPAPAALTTRGESPEWVVPHLPPQCAEIVRQIAALRQQAAAFERVAAVLWQSGPDLLEALRELFVALQLEVEAAGDGRPYDLKITLADGGSLLVQVVAGDQRIDRRAPVLARVLETLQGHTEEHDRVVLATNLFPDVPLDRRPDDQVTPDAMRLIQGLGANVVPTRTLFGIWKSSLEDPAQAKRSIMNLHAMDGGMFR